MRKSTLQNVRFHESFISVHACINKHLCFITMCIYTQKTHSKIVRMTGIKLVTLVSNEGPFDSWQVFYKEDIHYLIKKE